MPLVWTFRTGAPQTRNHVEWIDMEWTLYYDGGCNLCHTSQLRAEKWARAHGQPFRAEVLLSDEAIAKGFASDAMVLEADGKTLYGPAAWLKILTVAPWYLRWLSAMRLTAPTRWLAGVGYSVVANLRYRLYGRRTCELPSAKNRPAQSP